MCGERLQQRCTRERRRVTVLFIDLTSFTTLTLGFVPEELRDLADEVLTVVAGVIEDFDGYVDAFQGDGLIALFGRSEETRLNSSHVAISYAVFCLKKKSRI